MRLHIDALAAGARGVGRTGNTPVFVPAVIPGEVVIVRIVRRARRHLEAKLLEVVEPSPWRQQPPCPAFDRCGGCSLQHVASGRQLELKLDILHDALRTITGLEPGFSATRWPAPQPLGYRNRGQYPLGRQAGRVVTGFFAPGSHRVVPVERCLLHDRRIDEAVGCVRAWANHKKIAVYDEIRHRGLLRHAAARVAPGTGELLLTLVVRQLRRLPHQDLLRRLRRRLPELVGLVLSENPARTNVIFGKRLHTLWGRGQLREKFMGLELELAPASFFQVNSAQARVLFERVLDFLDSPDGPVVDAYCGAGLLGLLMGQRGISVLGIDSDAAAIASARRAAVENGVAGVEFRRGRVETVLPRLVEQGLRPAALVLDPPRRGCDRRVISAICSAAVPRLAYISCHPGTLARDLRLLLDGGFRLVHLEAVDMFPQTAHLEVLAGLER